MQDQEYDENQDVLCEIISILPFKTSSLKSKTQIITLKEGKDSNGLGIEFCFKVTFKPFQSAVNANVIEATTGNVNVNQSTPQTAFTGIIFHNVALNILGMSALNFLLLANKNMLVEYGFNVGAYLGVASDGSLRDFRKLSSSSSSSSASLKQQGYDGAKKGSAATKPNPDIIRDIMADQDLLHTLCSSSHPINLVSKLLLSQLVKVSIKSGKQQLDIIVNSLDLMFGMNPGSLNPPGTQGNSGLKRYLKRELELAFPAAKVLLERQKKRKLEEMMEREKKKIDKAFF